MKKTRFLSLFLSFLFLLAPSLAAVPSDSADCAVLMTGDGEVLYQKNADKRRGMASTTKIMTAVVALEHVPLDRVVTVSGKAVGVEGSSVYLSAGEKITMENLLYALMLQSANDAAAAIAIEVAGNVEAFADLMNEKARELGLSDTHFENPHGLDGETHYTTARELAMIAAYALQNPDFARIVSTVRRTVPLHDGSATRVLVNHNRLLRTHDDVIGIKTGFTKRCGRTLVSAARRDGLTLICVTLCDGDDWRDHRALLDYGFSLYETVTVLNSGEASYEVPVCGGRQKSVRLSNPDAVTLSRKKGEEITVKTEIPRFLYAGVEQGEICGTLRFFRGGKEVASCPLVAQETVEKNPKRTFWEKIGF